MSFRGRVCFVAICVAAVGCAQRDAQIAHPVTLRIVDSSDAIGWNVMEDRSRIFRIEARSPTVARRMDSVLAPLPIVVGDTLIVGLRLATTGTKDVDGTWRLFRLNLRSGQMDTRPIPSDAWYAAFDVIPSPDGRYVGYVGDDTTQPGGTFAAIRELGSGRLVVRGPGGGSCECDVDHNHVRWFPPDSFEVAVEHSDTDAGGWQVIAGRASVRRFRVDTLAHEPKWH